jgi:hypothetical protein
MGQSFDSSLHSKESCMVDVQFINLFDRCNANSYSGRDFPDFGTEAFSGFCA